MVLFLPGPPVSVAQPAAGGGEMTVDELVDQALRQNAELAEVNRTGLGLLQERVRTGAIPPLEGNLMQVEVNRLDASRQVLESRLEVLRLQLRALAGLAPDSLLAVRGALERSDVPMDRDVGGRRAPAATPHPPAARTEVGLAPARGR